jgi:O-antigen/teichoic acid export membrane protein
VKRVPRLAGAPGLRRSIAANFIGRGWTALSYFAAVPAYIALLGIESYGLIGFFLTLVALSAILELGLSTTLNRELSRREGIGESPEDARDLLRTLEVVYWGLAATIGLAACAATPLLAGSWLDSTSLPHATLTTALLLMSGVLFVQWPFTLYAGGLMGLERQVELNVIVVVAMTVRNGGAVLVLWLVSDTITAFFVWQLFGAGLQTFVTRAALWRAMPRADRAPRFRRAQLRRVWVFASVVSANAILAVILTQSDKLLLSKLISLRDFGYYSVAALLAGALVFVTLPIFQAVFPRLSRLVAVGDDAGLVRTYHQSCQLVAAAVIPVSIVIALFSPQILRLWTGDPATASRAGNLLPLLVVGTALNGLMNIPYGLSLAYGWTRFALMLNTVAVALFIPTLVVATNRYGATGAAAAWLSVNVGYVLIGIQVLHRRLLVDEMLRWYVRDVGRPVMAALAVAGAGWIVLPDELPDAALLVWMLVTLAASCAAALVACPDLRAMISRRPGTAPRRTSPG